MSGDQDSGEGTARSQDASERPSTGPGESAAPPPATDAPGAGADASETRPAFLPPADGAARQPFPPYPPPAHDPASQGAAWNIAVIIAGAVLLVSAFLPWAEARIVIDIFGRTLTRELGSVAGIEADSVVAAVPVLATVAIAMAAWGLITRDTRFSALSAAPGLLSLLVCALFVLRLDHLKDRLAASELSVGYEVAVVSGWYLAVAMSVLVTGFGLGRPISARFAGAREERSAPPPHPGTPAPGEAYAYPQAPPGAARRPQPQPQRPQAQTQPQARPDAPASPEGAEGWAPAGQRRQQGPWQKPE